MQNGSVVFYRILMTNRLTHNHPTEVMPIVHNPKPVVPLDSASLLKLRLKWSLKTLCVQFECDSTTSQKLKSTALQTAASKNFTAESIPRWKIFNTNWPSSVTQLWITFLCRKCLCHQDSSDSTLQFPVYWATRQNWTVGWSCTWIRKELQRV